MSMKSEENSQEILELMSLHEGGDIDVIVDANDLASLHETGYVVVLCEDAKVAVYSYGRRFAVVKFRGENVVIDNVDEWKTSIDECRICRDFKMKEEENIPCVDGEWCKKFAAGLYRKALEELSRDQWDQALDETLSFFAFLRHR